MSLYIEYAITIVIVIKRLLSCPVLFPLAIVHEFCWSFKTYLGIVVYRRSHGNQEQQAAYEFPRFARSEFTSLLVGGACYIFNPFQRSGTVPSLPQVGSTKETKTRDHTW